MMHREVYDQHSFRHLLQPCQITHSLSPRTSLLPLNLLRRQDILAPEVAVQVRESIFPFHRICELGDIKLEKPECGAIGEESVASGRDLVYSVSL